jgi:hypothetical protein
MTYITDDKPQLDPLDYLYDVMNDATLPRRDRIAAAGALLPYFHAAIAPEWAEEGDAATDATDAAPRMQ